MEEETHERLGDKILEALEMALDQEDKAIADLLGNALQMALTKYAGGKGFTERRDLSDRINASLDKWSELK